MLDDEPHGFPGDEGYMQHLANVWDHIIRHIKTELNAHLYVVNEETGELVETNTPDHARRVRMAASLLPLLSEGEAHRGEQHDAEL